MVKLMLRRKYKVTQDEWLFAYENAKIITSFEELEEHSRIAINLIREVAGDLRVGVSWSGGKDSLVAHHLACRAVNVTSGVIGRSNFEYPSFAKYMDENKPHYMKEYNQGYDLEWLVKKTKENPNILFPPINMARWWAEATYVKSQLKFLAEDHADVLIFGRRAADRNYIKKEGYYVKDDGKIIITPIGMWSHELVLAYIRYHNIKLSPIYWTKNGFSNGSTFWAARATTPRVENPKNWIGAWQEVYDIDREVLYEAAPYFKAAENCLKLNGDY